MAHLLPNVNLRKWEASIAAIAEIFALVNAVIEFVKHTS